MLRGYATMAGTQRFVQRHARHISNYVKFDDIYLSNVGMGMYLGDADDVTDKMVIQAVKDSVSAGVNVFDTAINYRSQKAERALGKALHSLDEDDAISRDSVFVCTKGGYVTNDADVQMDFWQYVKQQYADKGIIHENGISSQYHCMEISFLESQLCSSLKNLDVDCIDLLYLHNLMESQHQDVAREDIMRQLLSIMEWYETQRAEGRIRYYGLATWESFRVDSKDPNYLNLESILDMATKVGGKNHGLRFVQLPYNMYFDQALRTPTQTVQGNMVPFLQAAKTLNVGVFTSVPFMQGKLLSPGVLPDFGYGKPSTRSLQFIRSTPGVLAPLAGHKSPDHVDENLEVMKLPPLDESEFDSLLTKLLS
ncbi:MAG: aldo/keto reductase [Cenarchaeum sp. SB0663_bin_5]|nr:aldo/keto reductase [Cenarchaeum sp. SB0663_bin_5]MYH03860.1 aldo/keto reductase [Cenarchaeum sp. SB0675_bin_21]MYL11917.1 aldo/keto reductase [Cenarchaeum sp. SB0669_bin_11]